MADILKLNEIMVKEIDVTIAFWCVFILAFLPMTVSFFGKYKAGYTKEDNRNVREFYASATGITSRANAAQLNCYEIYPFFLGMVIIAHLTNNASQMVINIWSVLFVISRIAFCIAYLADKGTLRSVIFIFGLVCLVSLFIVSI